MDEFKNFELEYLLNFFEGFPTANKLEGVFVLKDKKYSFSAYRVPHTSGPPVLRIDIKKEG